MAKSKQQDEGARKTSKKSKKHSKPLKEAAAENEFKKSTLKRKQTELARVLELKCNMLLQGNLSYLEYIELREELCRLNVLKEQFVKLAAGFEKR